MIFEDFTTPRSALGLPDGLNSSSPLANAGRTADFPLTSATYGRLARQIVRLLNERAVKSGERLPSEKVLSSHFGVSRHTIRRALTALEITGAVETVKGVGSFLVAGAPVICPDLSERSSPLLLLRTCLTIETALASQAAKMLEPSTLTAMKRVLADMRKQARGPVDIVVMQELDIHFHELLAEAAGRQMVVITRTLWRMFYEQQNTAPLHCLTLSECRDQMLRSYTLLVESLDLHDSQRATQTMRDYLIMLQELLRYGISTEIAA